MFHSTTIILRAISREQLGTSGSEDLESTKKNSCRVPKVSDRAISIFLQILRPMPVLIFPCLSNYASNPCAIILVGKIFSVRKAERLHNISAIRIESCTYRACHYRSFSSHDRLECTASPLIPLMSFNTGLISVLLSYPMIRSNVANCWIVSARKI